MALTAQPFVLNALSLSLRQVTETDGVTSVAGVRQEYRCQLNTASLTPSAGTGAGTTTYTTFCADFEEAVGSGAGGSWVLNLAGFQAYQDAVDLSYLLFTEEGAIFEYTLSPNGLGLSAGPPSVVGFQGYVKATATLIGGVAQTYATFTVDLPCVTAPQAIDPNSTVKPKMIFADPVVMSADNELFEPAA